VLTPRISCSRRRTVQLRCLFMGIRPLEWSVE
jgi:hypothetical protein